MVPIAKDEGFIKQHNHAKIPEPKVGVDGVTKLSLLVMEGHPTGSPNEKAIVKLGG